MLHPRHSLLIFVCLATVHSTMLDSQTIAPNANGPVVFQANAQTVILDVVVTAQNGRPVEGLHKGDFVLAEDGHPQTITTFEELRSIPPGQVFKQACLNCRRMSSLISPA